MRCPWSKMSVNGKGRMGIVAGIDGGVSEDCCWLKMSSE